MGQFFPLFQPPTFWIRKVFHMFEHKKQLKYITSICIILASGALLSSCSFYYDIAGSKIEQDDKMDSPSIRRRPAGNPGGTIGLPSQTTPNFQQGIPGGGTSNNNQQPYNNNQQPYSSNTAPTIPNYSGYAPSSPANTPSFDYGAGANAGGYSAPNATSVITGGSDKKSNSNPWPFHQVEARFEPYAAEGTIEIDSSELRNNFEPMPLEGVIFMEQSAYQTLREESTENTEDSVKKKLQQKNL